MTGNLNGLSPDYKKTKEKTNEQVACNNWEKIGYLKGKAEAQKEFLEMINKLRNDTTKKFDRIDTCDELKRELEEKK